MKNFFVQGKVKAAIFGVCLASCLIFAPAASFAAASDISLPEPAVQDGMSVMRALHSRHSSRSFADAKLSPEQLSRILWAANGINRPDLGKRTNPAAMGVYSVDVYAVTDEGIYLYLPATHTLQLVAEGDFRMTTTKGQAFVGEAPLTLVYVGNSSAWQNARHVPTAEAMAFFDGVAAGAMSQSVGLMAEAEGIGTCVRASIDKEAFGRAARLNDDQTVILAQTLGILP